MAKRKRKRKLSPIGKLCVLIIIVIPIVIILSKCVLDGDKPQDKSKEEANSSGTYFTQELVNSILNKNKVKYAEKTADTDKLKAQSKYGILININDNKIVASKNCEKQMFPASMTKIMTLIVAVENMKAIDDTFTFTNEILDPIYQDEASAAGFMPGETVTVKDLLYGAILPSGADATSALAIYTSGSETEFVKLMNKKVNELGLKNTHFTNASGLHNPYHFSSAHDIALMLEYAMQDETMAEVLSTYIYKTSATPQHPEGIELYSTMFSRMYGTEAENVVITAGKTGYTDEGGNCLASFAEANGNNYILVTAGARGSYEPIYEALDIYAKYCGTGKVNIQPE